MLRARATWGICDLSGNSSQVCSLSSSQGACHVTGYTRVAPACVPIVTTAVSYLRALALLKVTARGAEVASGGKILSRICSQLTKTFFLTRSAIFCTLLVVFRNFYLPLALSTTLSPPRIRLRLRFRLRL